MPVMIPTQTVPAHGSPVVDDNEDNATLIAPEIEG
jgi:hypothetical protein